MGAVTSCGDCCDARNYLRAGGQHSQKFGNKMGTISPKHPLKPCYMT